LKKLAKESKLTWYNIKPRSDVGLFYVMKYLLLSIWILISVASAQLLPTVAGGTLIRHSQFPSSLVQPRNIEVWLPPGYDGKHPVDVLYMMDGQMLFDSNTTWNKQEWGVDETLTRLIEQGTVEPTMVVAIWNIPKRRPEYFPKKVFFDIPLPLRDTIQQDIGGLPHSDDFLKFIVYELKPFIDSAYRTRKRPNHTFIMGSSMGGLIALYAMCEYPNVFGGAACLSTHWPGSVYHNTKEVPDAFAQYLSQNPAKPSTHKLYLDCGDKGLDAWYPYGQALIEDILQRKHYPTNKLKCYHAIGADHTENAWSERLNIPLTFLLRPKR
jgi:enterochelin esterase-like enzyme